MELKHCPFCDKPAQCKVEEGIIDDFYNTLGCSNPDCVAYEIYYAVSEEDLPIEQAIFNWNQRFTDSIEEIVDDVVRGHRWGNDGSCGINTAIKAAIKGKFRAEVVMEANCQCGWKGKPDDRRTQWGKKAYCPACGCEAPIRKDYNE